MMPRTITMGYRESSVSVCELICDFFKISPATFRLFIYCICLGFSTLSLADDVTEQNRPAGHPILNRIIDAAQNSATRAYVVDDHDLADELKSMDYETYRQIRYNTENALWAGKHDYEVQMFHPGFLYNEPVDMVVIDPANNEKTFEFDSKNFIYEKNARSMAKFTSDESGYAGFRVHYPIKNSKYKDEFVVFQGASYFRLVGKNQVYGISARGLAIDTALPEGEEFPHFTKFWLIEPSAEGKPLTVYAMLQSPSVTGAYSFEIMPGTDTAVHVKAWLFAREDVQKLGVAPFTSMFLYGENSETRHDDYRPEIHDSDGVLMINKNDEQVWRPLTNPRRLQITSLSDAAPKGFGMLQRDGDFANYLDAEANYHLRPSLWVTPVDGFENGRLELVEIPTDSEVNDNMVAYWVPDEQLKAGGSRFFEYKLKTVEQKPGRYGVLNVIRTRQGKSQLPGFETTEEQNIRRFVVDFAVPKGMKIDFAKLHLNVTAARGRIEQPRIYPIDGDKAMRATFLVIPEGEGVVDMRMSINQNDSQISEVWNYVYEPQ